MQIARSLPVLLLPFLAFACAASNDDSSTSDESNLDTSGCSGLDLTQTKGAITVNASRPPTASCWNIAESGLSLSYSWTQTNNAQPEKSSVGFYVALNGGDGFQGADSYSCTRAMSGGLGHDTSGDQYFTCTARKRFDFAHMPQMKTAAYGADGHRIGWDVAVAIATDDQGNWDSLDGANYHFAF